MLKFGLCTLDFFILPSFKILMTCRIIGTTPKDIVDALITWGSVLITARFSKIYAVIRRELMGLMKLVDQILQPVL